MSDSDVWVDVEEAIRQLEYAQTGVREGDFSSANAAATVATIVFRRPFLPGFTCSWVTAQREKYARLLRRSLECLAGSWLALGQPELAIESATEATELDQTSEAACRLLIRANVAAGNSAEAVRSYHRLRDALSRELGMSPEKETEAAFLALLRQ